MKKTIKKVVKKFKKEKKVALGEELIAEAVKLKKLRALYKTDSRVDMLEFVM